ncbi:MAG TPA: hypothetical protein VFW98_13015 [Gemmatimonadaceae bacterium]|nr:hypothetical protein [Gemmatimonadaceae bacterium]
MEARIINPDPAYPPARLIEPTSLGYLLIAAEVHPRAIPLQRVLPIPRDRWEALAAVYEALPPLEQMDGVERITVFDAIAIPPVRTPDDAQHDGRQGAHFDVVIFMETESPDRARAVQRTPAYRVLMDTLSRHAKRVEAIAARNARRIADVDATRPGLFLFNYFVASDVQVAVQLWDYLAGWYEAETGLDNSTLLVPLEGESSPYCAINHARWDVGVFRLLWDQLSAKSFRTYVRANLEENRVTAYPILYRLAPRVSMGIVPSRAASVAAAMAGAGLAWWGWRRLARARARHGTSRIADVGQSSQIETHEPTLAAV